MEFLFEVIFELIFEGSIELISSRRVPMAVRVIAAVIFLTIALGVTAVLVLVSAAFVQYGQFLLLAVTVPLAVFFVFFIIKKLISFFKTRL